MPADTDPEKLARARPVRRDDADDRSPRQPRGNGGWVVWLAAGASVLCLLVAGAAVYTAVTATRQALAAKQQAADAEQRAAVAQPARVVVAPVPKPAASPIKAKPPATPPIPNTEPPDDEPTPPPADRPGRLDAEPAPPADQSGRGKSPVTPPPKPKTPADRSPAEKPPANGFAKPPQADGATKAAVDEAARQLRKGPTPQRRMEGAHKLREFGPGASTASAALCDALMDPSPSVAAAALQAIEQVRGDLYQPLTTLAVDGHGGNHVAAVKQLGLMGSEASCCAGLLLNRLRAELSRGPDYYTGELTAMQRALFEAIPQINPEDTGTVTYYKVIAAPAAQFDAAKWQALNALFTWAGADEGRRRQVLPLAVAAIRNSHCQGLGIQIVGEYGPLAKDAAPLLRQLKLAGDGKVRESAAKALDRVEGR